MQISCPNLEIFHFTDDGLEEPLVEFTLKDSSELLDASVIVQSRWVLNNESDMIGELSGAKYLKFVSPIMEVR